MRLFFWFEQYIRDTEVTNVLTYLSTVYTMSHEYDVDGGQVSNPLFMLWVLVEDSSTGDWETTNTLNTTDFDILFKRNDRSAVFSRIKNHA